MPLRTTSTRVTGGLAPCLIALALAVTAAAPAAASPVLHYDGGTLTEREDPALPPASMEPPPPPGPCAEAPGLRAAANAVKDAISRARSKKQITSEQAAHYNDVYSDARATRSKISSYRGELSSVIEQLERIAGRGQLTASRMPALFLQLDRNAEFWGGSPKFPPRYDIPAEPCQPARAGSNAGARIEFEGSQVIFQYYPGNGLQIQPLANFGKANGIYTACRRKEARCDPAALKTLLDELVAIRSSRGGFTTWEYWFPFSGGSPPWVSGMAQGTAVQALARGSVLLKDPSYLTVAKGALGIFEKSTPVGVKASGLNGGSHYVLYSFAPGLRVFNGFLQAITGIYDYAKVAKDARAKRLFTAGDRSARREVPRADTGAWSLYSMGGAESNLNYHNVVTDFLGNLCSRTKTSVYCDAKARFDRYKKTPPVVRYKGPGTVKRGTRTALAFTLNKVSCVTATIRDAGGGQVYRSQIKFARGRRSFTWQPGKAGDYTLEIQAEDLRKNKRTVTRKVTVRGS
jgi:hypothetical protein